MQPSRVSGGQLIVDREFRGPYRTQQSPEISTDNHPQISTSRRLARGTTLEII
jgi:hypothetical protein